MVTGWCLWGWGRGELRGPGVRLMPWMVVAVVVGCGGTAGHSAAGPPPETNPSQEGVRVVAEFLDAARLRDHTAMAARFGTGTAAGGGGGVGRVFGVRM